MLSAAVVAGALYAGVGAAWAGQHPSASHVVSPGDTLWSVAVEHYPPSEDPRAAVEAIRRANGLDGYGLRPGTPLELPPLGP